MNNNLAMHIPDGNWEFSAASFFTMPRQPHALVGILVYLATKVVF